MKNVVKLLPLLVVYILMVLLFSSEQFLGDEQRHLNYAHNLSKGYYSPQDNVSLENGPGYPIILLPFVLMKLPLISMKLLNAILMFLAIIYFYLALSFYIPHKYALIGSYIIGIYPPFFRYIHSLHSEYLAIFLVCGFIFHFCAFHRSNKINYIQLIITSAYLGYLAITKVFFGYIALGGIIIVAGLYLLKKRLQYRNTVIIYALALILCFPYLIYTYSLTGKFFYWGTSGGEPTYWISTPYENEYGNWYGIETVSEHPQLYKNHGEFYLNVMKLPDLQKDLLFKERSIQNIKNYPLKYCKNIAANIGRMLFNYPYSYTPQKLSTYFYLIPDMFLVVFFVLCIYPSYRARRLVPPEIYLVLLFGLITFGLASLITEANKQFIVMFPFLAPWIIFTIVKNIRIKIVNN